MDINPEERESFDVHCCDKGISICLSNTLAGYVGHLFLSYDYHVMLQRMSGKQCAECSC